MKKTKGIILLTSLAFFNIGIVKAADRCDTLKLIGENSSFQQITTVYMNYNANGISSHPNYKYLFKEGNNEYTTYCRNAGYSSGKSPGHDRTYSCNETILDPTSDNEAEKKYHAGIMGILLNGYSNINPNYFNNSYVDNVDRGYVATNIALRVYEMLWERFNTNGINNTASNNAHKYLTNLMLDDANIKKKLKEATGNVRNKFPDTQVIAVTQIDGKNVSIDNALIKEVKRLIVKGLEDSIDYKKNGAALVTYKKPQVFKENKGNGVFEATLSFNITAEKFSEEDSSLNLSFDCEKCKNYGVSYKTYINDEEMDIKDVNLLKNRDENDKINLKVVLTSNANFSCGLLSYNLKIKYKDPSLLGEAYSMRADGFSSSASVQQFYVLYSINTEREETFSSDLDICSLGCDEIKQMCSAGNQAMCDRLNNEFGGDCVNCTAFVSPIECNENDQELYIKEGIELNEDTKNCKANKDSKLNILQCIVNNSDKSGNSYKAYEYTNNKYCSVFCKEDYHFVLPGIKEVRSGRYFTLQASVDGKKSCYTSKIDSSTFYDDLEAARKIVIEAYNKWSRLNAIVNADFVELPDETVNYNIGTVKTVDVEICRKGTNKCKKCNDCSKYRTDLFDCKKANICEFKVSSCTAKKAKKTFRYEYCVYDYDEKNHKDKTKCFTSPWETEIYGSVNAVNATNENCSAGSCSVINYLDDYNSKGYEAALGAITTHTAISDLDPTKAYSYTYSTTSGAIGELQSAINKFFLIVNDYNSCSGFSDHIFTKKDGVEVLNPQPYKFGWKINYNYDAKVAYWYQEKYMNDVTTDNLDIIDKVEIDSDYEQINCYVDVDNEYVCRGMHDTDKVANVVQKRIFMCMPKDGSYECAHYKVAISTVHYVSQTIGMKADYITPTQFQHIYPTNSIVVADKDGKVENASIIVNGLPVSSKTKPGVYTYALKVEDLGEYYNTTKKSLGRIWGADESVVVNTLEELKACYKDSALQEGMEVEDTILSNGVYICAYRVNCPPDGCPVVCDPPPCINKDCPSNDCPIEVGGCPDCIITNDKYNFDYRPVTSGNLNPNKRPLGNNWNWDKSITEAIELKAYTTTKEIEIIGEEIYDTTKDSYVMKVTMDSALISSVREYNDQHGENYLNNTLKCYDLKENGNEYKNVFCYSTFLDEMIKNHSSKFSFNKKRPKTNAQRKNSIKSDYWTTWTKAVADEAWNITTINTVEIAKIDKVDAKSTNYKNKIGIGPSWK